MFCFEVRVTRFVLRVSSYEIRDSSYELLIPFIRFSLRGTKQSLDFSKNLIFKFWLKPIIFLFWKRAKARSYWFFTFSTLKTIDARFARAQDFHLPASNSPQTIRINRSQWCSYRAWCNLLVFWQRSHLMNWPKLLPRTTSLVCIVQGLRFNVFSCQFFSKNHLLCIS